MVRILKKYSWILVVCLSIASLSFLGKQKKIRVYLAGDSIMQAYNTSKPQRGWGQILPQYFDDQVLFINKARGGRSTKSFRNEGLWQQLLDSLQKGDWVMVGFGHNDQTTERPERYTTPDEFYTNLKVFVKDVRKKGAVPVLLTPVAIRSFNDSGTFEDQHGAYPGVIRKVAGEMKVPLIDLHLKTTTLVKGLGPEESKKLYMVLQPGEHPSYPEGLYDNNHLKEAGAKIVAQIVAEEISRLKLNPLSKHRISITQ